MYSSVEELTHTNAPPSPAQVIQIRSKIAKLKNDECKVNGALAQIRTPLPAGLLSFPKFPPHTEPTIMLQRQLLQRKEELVKHMDAQTLLLSATRRLPAEIVQMIFVNCLPLNHVPLLHPLEVPLLLCHICSGWRSLALNTPALWSMLSFTVPNLPSYMPGTALLGPHVSGSCGALASVNLWLQNSPSSPLSFCFACTQNSPLVFWCFSAFASQSHRWRTVTIRMLAPDFVAEMMRSPLTNTMDALQALGIEFAGADLVDSEFMVRLCRLSPHLLSFTLFCGGFHFLPHKSPLEPCSSWDRLTRLNIFPSSNAPQYFVQLHDTLDILRHTPNLIICALYMMHSRISPPPPVPGVTLDQLVSLHIATDQNLGYLFDRLAVPNIRDIQLDFSEDLFGWPHIEFISLIGKANWPLVRFGVHTKTMKEDQLIECLQMMPMLTCLELGVENKTETVGDRVLGLLTPQDESGCLTQRLATFVLCVGEENDMAAAAFSDEAFLGMVAKRSLGQSSSLRRVELRRDKELDARFKQTLFHGCGSLQVCPGTLDNLFTPEYSKEGQDRLWEMMSDARWTFDDIWEAYKSNI